MASWWQKWDGMSLEERQRAAASGDNAIFPNIGLCLPPYKYKPNVYLGGWKPPEVEECRQRMLNIAHTHPSFSEKHLLRLVMEVRFWWAVAHVMYELHQQLVDEKLIDRSVDPPIYRPIQMRGALLEDFRFRVYDYAFNLQDTRYFENGKFSWAGYEQLIADYPPEQQAVDNVTNTLIGAALMPERAGSEQSQMARRLIKAVLQDQRAATHAARMAEQEGGSVPTGGTMSSEEPVVAALSAVGVPAAAVEAAEEEEVEEEVEAPPETCGRRGRPC